MKLRDVFRFDEIIFDPNQWNLLDERYDAQRKDSKHITQQIVSSWLDLCIKIIKIAPSLEPYIELDKDGNEVRNPVLDSIRNPITDNDKMMKFMLAYSQGKVKYPKRGIKIPYALRDVDLTITLKLTDSKTRHEGKTVSKNEEKSKPNVDLTIPTYLFDNFVFSIKTEKARSIAVVERFLMFVHKAIYHEIAHAVQFITGTAVVFDMYDLDVFEKNKLTDRIHFIMYALGSDEMGAMFNETYVEYTRAGKYYKNAPNKRKTKKNFVDLLFCDILWRADYSNLADEYRAGEKTWDEILEEINPSVRLFILWSIFVYGLGEYGLDKLVVKDDKKLLVKKYNTKVIEANVDRIKEFFARFSKRYKLQRFFIERLSEMNEIEYNELFSELFSIDKSNEDTINTMLSWGLDSLMNNGASNLPLLGKSYQ